MSKRKKPLEIGKGYQPQDSSCSGAQAYGYRAKTKPEDVRPTNKELHDLAGDIFNLNPSSGNESSSDAPNEQVVDKSKKLDEIKKNFEAFQKLLPSIEQTYTGKFAVLRQKEITDYFDSMSDAVKYAEAKYEDGVYSVQQVSNRVADLDFFSHADSI